MKTALGIVLLSSCFLWMFAIPFLPTDTDRTIDVDLSTDQEQYLLVFFGYTGCGSDCPITMSVLRQVYLKYEEQASPETLGVRFMDMMVQMEPELAQTLAHDYAQTFHPSFQGIHLPPAQLQQWKDQFGFSLSEADQQAVRHQGFIWLLERQQERWSVQKIYLQAPLSPQQILSDLAKLRSTT